MANNDYGYFGKGITGYVHYTQAHNRAFSGSKPTTKGGSPVPTNSSENIENIYSAMRIFGTIFAILAGFTIALQVSSYLNGWITVVEFSNETAGTVICFTISLACAIIGFRHKMH